MRVLHLEAGRHLYGGALQVQYLLGGLRAHPVDNVLLCPQGSELATAAAGLATLCPLPMGGDLDLGMAMRVRRLLKAHQADLLHVHSRRGADHWGALAAGLAGVPALVTRRVDNAEPPWLARWKYHHWYRHVVSISEGVRQVLLREGVAPQRVSTIRSAVDTERFQPQTDWTWFTETFDYRPGDTLLGIAAQMIERKGHKLLFKVLPELFREFPHLRLLVLGRGPLETQLKDLVVQLGLSARVDFLGFREDLHKILPHLSLLVHPAYFEGLGVALLQAAACGVPVVSCLTGGIPEAVAHGEHGLLVPPGDERALGEAVAILLRDPPLRARYAARARQRMLEEFSIAAMAEQNFALYRQLLAH